MSRIALALAGALVLAAHDRAAAQDATLPARWSTLRALPRSGSAEMGELLDDIAARRVDPWALVRHLAPRAEVPASARYHAECSAAYGVPTAIFSLGDQGAASSDRALAAMATALPKGRAATAEDKRRQFEMTARVASAVNAAPGVRDAVRFYESRGATVGTVNLHYPLSWRGDEPGRALHVIVRGRNPYASGPHAACRAMPRGPMLELSVR